jgi:hypothetical protein
MIGILKDAKDKNTPPIFSKYSISNLEIFTRIARIFTQISPIWMLTECVLYFSTVNI